jgi:predicted GIY-YIG superfamily endonuclease
VYQTSTSFSSGTYDRPAFYFDPHGWRWRAESVVYLLHFSDPISPLHTAQHYLGWTNDLGQRLADHAAGRGARLTQVALERGISWQLAAIWPGDRAYERWLKSRKCSPRFCPICLRHRRTLVAHCDIPF